MSNVLFCFFQKAVLLNQNNFTFLIALIAEIIQLSFNFIMKLRKVVISVIKSWPFWHVHLISRLFA